MHCFKPKILGLALFLAAPALLAKDLGFRYKLGRCLGPQGQEGRNPGHIGQCGDLRNTRINNLDLSGMDLSGALFSSADLQLNNFSGAILQGVNFDGAQLSGANFQDTKLDGVNFSRTIMKNVKLNQASIEGADFSGADMDSLKLSYIKFENCLFQNSNMNKVELDGAHMINAQMAGAVLSGANLEGALLQDVDLENANLREALLSLAELKGVNLNATNLRRANLGSASLENVTFAQSKISKATILPFLLEEALKKGMVMKADCNADKEVEYLDHCYYLDGSAGRCLAEYVLAPQAVLAVIGILFKGKTYMSQVSSNCCIWHSKIEEELEDYGMEPGCNSAGVFAAGPTPGGTGCGNANNRTANQLTLCMSND